MEEEFTTKPLQKLLVKLYDDLTEAARDLRKIRHAIKEPSFTHPRTLIPEVRELTGLKKASMEDLIKLWISGWKVQGRKISLGKGSEVALLGFKEDSVVDVYELFTPMLKLFKS